jgi:3-(3-hydroxy-phenyl)propionate hydroxylase
MSSSNQEMPAVAVVGAGPVGLALCSLLLRQNVTVALLDRGQYGVVKPRATHLDDEAVRVMQAMGVAEELEPAFYSPSPFSLYDSDWNEVAHSTMSDKVGDQAWRYDYMFHQPTFETRMREIFAASSALTAYYGVDVTDVTQDADHATVHAHDLDAGSDFVVNARYVVGCDGAHSIVRRAMGADLEDLEGTQRWMVIDLLVDEGVSIDDQLHTYAAAPPGRTYTFVPTGVRRRRVEYRAFDEETNESLERDEMVWKLLEKWVTPETAAIERADVYQFNALIAEQWRNGRLFVAGDAAHQMPPKAGQGLCTGLRDAANLAWKLAFELQGKASAQLLDTYQSERLPHARIWIEISNGIARTIEAISEGRQPEISGEQSPESRPPIGPGLHRAPPPAGLLSYQPILTNGTRLDDRIGLNFAVIGRADVLKACDASTRSTWDEISAVVLDAAHAGYDKWLEERHQAAIVIRPDRYIFGVAETALELDGLATRLTVALGADTRHPVAATEAS